jgi:hypothetical protein
MMDVRTLLVDFSGNLSMALDLLTLYIDYVETNQESANEKHPNPKSF